MLDSYIIFLLCFMVFCIIGAIYCAWFKDCVPVIDLDQVITDLGYTKEQFIEDDYIADKCYAAASFLKSQVIQKYLIRKEEHYKGVKYGLIAGAVVGAGLFLTDTKR